MLQWFEFELQRFVLEDNGFVFNSRNYREASLSSGNSDNR